MEKVIQKINVDKNPELAAQFKVRSIPALFYFKNGEVGTQNGVQSKSAKS
jgi:thioredoxin 1